MRNLLGVMNSMIAENIVADDVNELMEQTGQKADALGNYIEIRPSLLIVCGIIAVVLVLALFFLLWICIRQRKEKRTHSMAAMAAENKPVESVLIGKLHELGERSGQQDCFGVSDESLMQTHGLLAVVADGMGGLSDGDKVSTAAVEAILDNFFLYQGRCTLEQQLLMLVQSAVESVNKLLGPSGFSKSGSTLVMGLLRESAFSFLSVGDSRVYLYRQGILMQLNREHIYKNKLALDAVNGELPLQEVYGDSRGSGLISFLGMGALQYIDFPAEPIRLIAGDKLLLMSDGVYNALDNETLAKCLEEDPEEAVVQIREAIQEKGYSNQDNYTAVIIGCK